MSKNEVRKRIENTIKVLNTSCLGGEINDIQIERLLEELPTTHAIGTTSQFIMDLSSMKYLYLGKNIENITGFSRIELVNIEICESLAKFIPGEQGIMITDLNLKCFDTLVKDFNGRLDVYVTMDLGIVRRDGSIGRLLAQLRPLVWSKSDLLIAGGYYTDITHLKKEGPPVVTLTCNGDVLHSFEPNMTDVVKDNLTEFTRRELEILALTAKGSSTKEIADKTGLTISTLYAHRRNILSKSSIRSIPKLIESLRLRGVLSGSFLPSDQVNLC